MEGIGGERGGEGRGVLTLEGFTPGAYRAFLMKEERPPATEGKLPELGFEGKLPPAWGSCSFALALGSGMSHFEPPTPPNPYPRRMLQKHTAGRAL